MPPAGSPSLWPLLGGSRWIDSFVASWALFQYTYLAGWLIGLLLSLVGVLVVARDQFFLGAAMSQASAWALLWGWGATTSSGVAWVQSEGFLSLMAVVFPCSALFTARGASQAAES